MYDYKESLLCELLNCGSLDLKILENVEYDFCDIVEYAKTNLGEVNLDSLFISIVSMGLGEFQNSIDTRIKLLEKNNPNSEELEALKDLDASDIEWYFNYLDSGVYIVYNKEIYEKYCQHEISEFEKNTGLCL